MVNKTVAVFAIVLMATAAFAEEIRLDLGAAYTPAGNWNVATTPRDGGMSNLIEYETGNETAVNVAWDMSLETSASGNWRGDYVNDAQDWVVNAAGDDMFYTILYPGGNLGVTFSELSEAAYRVEVLCSHDAVLDMQSYTFTTYDMGFSISGAAADRTYQGNPIPARWDWYYNGCMKSDWLIWDSVSAVDGEISIDLIGSDEFIKAGANAIRLVGIVPEPASALSLLVGGGLLTAMRRYYSKFG